MSSYVYHNFKDSLQVYLYAYNKANIISLVYYILICI